MAERVDIHYLTRREPGAPTLCGVERPWAITSTPHLITCADCHLLLPIARATAASNVLEDE